MALISKSVTQRLLRGLITIAFLFEVTSQIETPIFSQNYTIKFAEVSNLKLDLTNLISDDFLFQGKNPFLRVMAKMNISDVCSQTNNKNLCTAPIIIYGKLNSEPEPDQSLYDIKEDSGIIDGDYYTLGFEFTPCEFSKNDTLYIKIVGIEGQTNLTLSSSFNILTNFQVYCTKSSVEPKVTLFPSILNTALGTISFGGKEINSGITGNEMFLLDQDLNWSILEVQGSIKPSPRYGASIVSYDNYLILFGGKNQEEQLLNELWIFNLSTLEWLNIDFKATTNLPEPVFAPSSEIIENQGLIVYFGGEENFSSTSVLNFLDIAILFEIVEEEDPSKKYTKINYLWKIVNTSIQHRFGATITQINENELLVFGGYDVSKVAMKNLEILNLHSLEVQVISPTPNSIFPAARAFHGILKFGKILILYGGEASNNLLFNDLWKFVISTKKWIPIKSIADNQFYLYRARFSFTKLPNQEHPVMFGGKNKNKQATNDLIMLDFDYCLSDDNVISDFKCLPCSEGYVLNKSKCEICSEGTYHNTISPNYSESQCDKCPIKTFNQYKGKKSVSSCILCKYGTYNSLIGQKECSRCPTGEICLPGSVEPSKSTELKDKISNFHLQEENYPDFISSNRKQKDVWQFQTFIVAVTASLILLFILAVVNIIWHKKVVKFLISADFLTITGGNTKKLIGGILFLTYLYFNIVFILTFVLRFIYYNELTEVIPISSSHGTSLKVSFEIDLELVGYEYGCIDSNKKLDNNFYLCSPEIEVGYTDSSEKLYKSLTDNKNTRCRLTSEQTCKINIICENCKMLENDDSLIVKLNNPAAYIQLYYWSFVSTWGENLSKENGYSKLVGIFKPDERIEIFRNNYLFRGEEPSSINILLTPIFFSNKSEYTQLQGYRSTFNSYERGSVKSIIGSNLNAEGVSLKLNFLFASNQYEINVWKQIAFLDFYAFILGMFAGLSFLTRVSKNLLERLNVLNISEKDFEEDQNQNIELTNNLENSN